MDMKKTAKKYALAGLAFFGLFTGGAGVAQADGQLEYDIKSCERNYNPVGTGFATGLVVRGVLALAGAPSASANVVSTITGIGAGAEEDNIQDSCKSDAYARAMERTEAQSRKKDDSKDHYNSYRGAYSTAFNSSAEAKTGSCASAKIIYSDGAVRKGFQCLPVD